MPKKRAPITKFDKSLTAILNSDSGTKLKLQKMLQKIGGLPQYSKISGKLDPAVKNLSDALFRVEKPKVVRKEKLIQNFSLQSEEALRIVQNLRIRRVNHIQFIWLNSKYIPCHHARIYIHSDHLPIEIAVTKSKALKRGNPRMEINNVQVAVERSNDEDLLDIFTTTERDMKIVVPSVFQAVWKAFRTDKLSLRTNSVEISEHFSENITRRIDNFEIDWPKAYAKDVTRECLLKLDSENIRLRFPELTSEDINAFLAKWKRGELSRLKTFFIKETEIILDEEQILMCLQAFRCREDNFEWDFPDMRGMPFQWLWNIRDVNGKLGYFELRDSNAPMLFSVKDE